MEESQNTNEQKDIVQKRSKAKVILSVIAGVLGTVLAAMVILYFLQRQSMVEMETLLTEQKDSLTNELIMLKHGYDTLKTDNDTLNAKLEQEKLKIERLLAINASNVQTIRTYKREIATMREIMKSYIVQIDSLNTINQQLVAENVGFKQQISDVQNTNIELTKAKEELSSKVEVAAVIQAKDINAVTLNRKRKETTRINLIDKLRICFTLRENPIAAAGEKEVFMRVIRPDSLVITTSPDNLFDYKGNKLVYSASRLVDYMNQDIEMCIFLDNTGDFIIGNYSVELFLESHIIGRTTFALSKR